MNPYSELTKFGAHREPWLCDTISIHMIHVTTRDGARSVAVAQPPVMVNRSTEELNQESVPFLRLRPDEAQQLIDELWRTGIRPTDGSGSAGQMAATEKHLEDMRTLVFAKLPPKPAPANC